MNRRKRHIGTDDMLYLDRPLPVRVEGHDGIALVVDTGRVFARWIDGGTVHLAWTKNFTIPRHRWMRPWRRSEAEGLTGMVAT